MGILISPNSSAAKAIPYGTERRQKSKKNLSSPSSQELVPLTLESVYGTLLTHSSLFSQSDRHRILHFEFRVVLNFSDMTS